MREELQALRESVRCEVPNGAAPSCCLPRAGSPSSKAAHCRSSWAGEW
jgi:hypothetical protein